MEEPNIEQRVIELLAEKLGLDPSDLSRETRFADLNIDSLDRVELVMLFEDSFDRSVSDDVVENFETVGQLIDWLDDNSGGAGVTAKLPKPKTPPGQNHAPQPNPDSL